MKRPAAPRDDPLLDCLHMLLGAVEDDAAVVESLRGIRAAFIANLLYRRIDSFPDVEMRTRARWLIDAIPAAAVGAFVASPALCEVLRCNLSEARLLALLEAASAAACDDGLPPPALAGGLSVDGSLPAALAHPHGGLGAPRFLDAAEVGSAIARVDAALDLLRAVYPTGATLFEGLVGNFVLRADEMRPEEVWGASSGLAIGRVLLVNAHVSASREMLAEALLHEAVHCALDCAELVRPMFSLAAMVGEAASPSPWSANPLSRHAFVHASVVWATLLKFWCLFERRFGGNTSSRARIAYIVAGFDRIDLSAIEAECRRELSDAAFAAVEIACGHAMATTTPRS